MGKEIEKPSAFNGVSLTLLEATSALAENLLQTEPFLQLKAAEDKLNADPAALRMLADLSELKQTILTQQFSAGLSQGDIDRLRELQSAVATNETIQAHEQARGYAIALLREVNQEISNLLGVDFAALTRRASGCC